MLAAAIGIGSTPHSARATSERFPQIEVREGRFVDHRGGTRIFRGVNLSGSAKRPLPRPDGETFFDHRSISFVGRPMPLAEADEHLERIASWGFDLIRLVVPWEAIEHESRGELDEIYLDSVVRWVDLAAEHGLWVVIDPHQDVWSRFTGGDGAPGWTLEELGFDLEGLVESGGAVVEELAGGELPAMIWPTNYTKLGSATLFTLFFGGNDFAPATLIDGNPVQEVLQGHFLAAFAALAARLGDRPNVLGYEVLNEPHPGFIGIEDLRDYAPFPLRNGSTPTPLEAMQAGAGLPTEVANWAVGTLGIKEIGREVLNPEGRSAWLQSPGIWEANGVWGVQDGKVQLLRPDHFSRVEDRQVDFNEHYYKPFIERFVRTIREHDEDAVIFAVPAFVYGLPQWSQGELENVASGAHFYDQVTLIKKRFLPWLTLDLRNGKPVFGSRQISVLFAELAHSLGRHAESLGGDAATFVGETGIPFDLNNGKAFETGDFSAQSLALDRSLAALEQRGMSYAIWNYTHDNSNRQGDRWNGEDLSIFSPDQGHLYPGLDSGGRALRAAVRPAASRIAGRLESANYDPNTAHFRLVVDADPEVGDTIVRVPILPYPETPRVTLSSGTFRFDDHIGELVWTHKESGLQELELAPLVPPDPIYERPVLRWILLALLLLALILAQRLWRARST